MEKRAKNFLVVVGTVYILLVLGFLFGFSGCSVICENVSLGIICGCTSQDLILFLITLGLPAWILFLIVIASENKN